METSYYNAGFCDLFASVMNLESLMRSEQPQKAEGQRAVLMGSANALRAALELFWVKSKQLDDIWHVLPV